MFSILRWLRSTTLPCVLALASIHASAAESRLRAWYQQPATKWEEAIPLGNGRLGAMVFGGTSGIIEMLLKSHTGVIHLLPALPKAWPTGSIKGLCARGGLEVDLAWQEGKLREVTLHSKLGQPAKVRYGNKVISLATKAGESRKYHRNLE